MKHEIIEHVEALMLRLEDARGQVIAVDESISRMRRERFGHDRHFASSSRFSMTLKHVGFAVSGSSLTLEGTCGDRDCWYQIALEAVVSLEVTDHVAVVVEQFEQHTERRSTIQFAR